MGGNINIPFFSVIKVIRGPKNRNGYRLPPLSTIEKQFWLSDQ
jgi:hypothetical protein